MKSYLLALVAPVAVVLAAAELAGAAPFAGSSRAGGATSVAAPEELRVVGATSDAVSLAWRQTRQEGRVVAWGVYRGDVLVKTVDVQSATLTGLPCGRSFRLAVDSVDKQGRRSEAVAIDAATLPCPDTTPPAAPTLTLAESEPDQHVRGATIFLQPASADGGSFEVTAESGDAESGIRELRFPSLLGSPAWADAAAPYARTYTWLPGAAADGVHDVVAVNGEGLTATSSFTVATDAAAPQTSDDAASLGADWQRSPVTVSLAAADAGAGVAATHFTTDGTTPTTASPAGGNVELREDGVYTVRYFSVDNVGNAEEVRAAANAIRVDVTPPSAPALDVVEASDYALDAGDVLYVNTAHLDSYSVYASSNDGTSGLARVRFPGGAEDVDEPFWANYSFADLAGAQSVVAVDHAGNEAATEFTVVADVDPPAGGSVSYADGFAASPSLNVASDPGVDALSGLGEIVLERSTAGLVDGTCRRYGDWTTAISPDTVASGTCVQYRLRVSDRVANETTYTSARVVKADFEPPAVTMDDPGALLHETVGLTATALDSVSGVATLRYEVAPAGSDAWTTVPSQWDTRTVANGLYDLRVVATDAAGNSAVSLPVLGRRVANADLFVATTGSDADACTRTAPCFTFDRAYKVAQPGETVEVAGGTYPQQTIRADAAKTSPDDVVFRPAPTEQVTISGGNGEIVVYASHVEFRGMTTFGWTVHPGADDVTFRDIEARGGVYVLSASNVSMIGGSVGPGVDYDSIVGSCWNCSVAPRNVLFDGVDFHDWTRTASQHVECLQIGAVDGLTIRNSRFRNCAVHDVFIRSFGPVPVLRNIVIENNFLGATRDGYYSLRFANTTGVSCESVLVRNNSAAQPIYSDCAPLDVRFVANVGPLPAWSCSSGVIYEYNVWDGARCGESDLNAPSGFVDAASGDFHLVAGAAAIDRGDPAGFPERDIDGDTRPRGAAPDAGADER